MNKENHLQHNSLIVVKTSSISKLGMSMTPSLPSNNSRIHWAKGFGTNSFSASCVVPTKSTKGTVARPFSYKTTAVILEATKEWTNFDIRDICWVIKSFPLISKSKRRAWVVYGTHSVRRTALFQSIFIWRADLQVRFHVWHPNHEQQCVCSNWPLTLPNPLGIEHIISKLTIFVDIIMSL